MLQSNRCNLRGLSRKELVQKGEEALERGGYFVCKGSEKVIRLLIANRRNYPIAIIRRSFKDKGALFSQYGVMMRCVKENHSASMITLHYLESATISIAVQFRREIFYIPLMYVIKALVPLNDSLIYENMIRARPNDPFWHSCVTNMLACAQEDGIISQEAALKSIGAKFRVAMSDRVAPWETDEDVGRFLLKYCVAIHLDDNMVKFHTLCYMSQKLIALVKGECMGETPDNPQFQEASVSGHIILLIIRERMETILTIIRKKLEIIAKKRPDTFSMTSNEFLRALGSQKGGEITRTLEYFLATGNLMTRSGLALQQNNGFTVIAERINQLRFVSHFRAVHRGAFFMEMRTTDVRKLRPEAWGFICPVHTPDGAPCGLLNHVTASCRVLTNYQNTSKIPELLGELGMFSHAKCSLMKAASGDKDGVYPVLMDGQFLGYVPRKKAAYIERQLRAAKVTNDDRVPAITEIALVRHSTDPKNVQTQYPGLYIFCDSARFYRPVKNLAFNRTEFIGTFEQVYMSIVIDPDEAEEGVTMHQELHPSCLFSFAGNLIPFPDHNQSPRNVYQCQMGKQTMGVPVHAWHKRADNKMYRLQFAQTPLLQLEAHHKYEMDEYPLGTNACVAVISYTGYDMEDAMVINKSSYQRGFAHGTVIKVERINLIEERGAPNNVIFLADPKAECKTIDKHGLPIQGRMYQEGDVYYSVYDMDTGNFRVHKYKYVEPGYCGIVRVVDENERGLVHALIQWRVQRNPIIGDKFASRHGQKGINSFLWPVESLPFSESGMVPDIIFNPHGFPSRMTIGMMIESMAGKSAAMHGAFYDASPFVFNEKKTAIDHFGQLLTKAGYNYYGNEVMYSGVDGREMKVEIFFGIVYYQRLRHMIADKYQVRATGPIDPVTHQPVKGRKKGGGIRFGEMERDALIAHGTSFCLQDRLLNCSDRDYAYVCAKCGTFTSVLNTSKRIKELQKKRSYSETVIDYTDRQTCRNCQGEKDIYNMQVPRVFQYLAAELSAMNIKIQMDIKPPKEIRH
uniref:DNA-directed RNA polymerase subunit beta n=1 Tax=Steinernema glaseri TaxID=37863 RepID=A0A1I7ZCR6_9BILA